MTREEAHRILSNGLVNAPSEHEWCMAFEMAIEALEQEPKTGHWIDTGSGQECSECGEIQHGYDNFRYFCAKCGSYNGGEIEPQERSE